MKISKALIAGLALAIGLASGILFQRYYGLGKALATLGLNSQQVTALPTALPSPQPTPQPTPLPTPQPTPQPDPLQLATQVIYKSKIPEEYQGKLQLFILAGQSNMVGRGEFPPPAEVDPRIFVFGNDYHWRIGHEPVDDPYEQVDRVSRDPEPGYGPAASFATALLQQNPDIVIGLIPCAKGSSSIQDWQRSLSDLTLYGSCLKRARAASVMGDIAGLLFFQGETEAADPAQVKIELYPQQWAQDFTNFVIDLRADLGLPQLPVVFAQIGSNSNPDYFVNWEVVQEQQKSVQLPYSRMITTSDLEITDLVHFTTESYQAIGRRFAKAYLELTRGD